jgi:uncharacterized protein (TIGR01244 family)
LSRSLLLGFAAALLLPGCAADPRLAPPFERLSGVAEAPFPTADLAAIEHYTRASPFVALAGRPGQGGIEAAAEAGFRTVIDLRGPEEEGAAGDRSEAERLGLTHLSLPMPSEAKDAAAFTAALAALLDERAHYPILLHCASANRAAAAWALYRARGGTAPLTALEEARAAGLTSREPFLREVLELEGLSRP